MAVRVVPPMPRPGMPGTQNANSEPPRDPPQYYSSSDEQEQNTNPQTPPVAVQNQPFNGPAAGNPGNPIDPNNGAVTPPNFNPQQMEQNPNAPNNGGNPQADPNQTPQTY
jgi:hypothetical protein